MRKMHIFYRNMRFSTTFLIFLLPILASTCEPDWKFFNGHCYRAFSLKNYTVTSSQQHCVGLGALLTSITSDEERKFVVSLAHTGSSKHHFYQTVVGLVRDAVKSPWKWLDGCPYTGLYWHEREPNNDNGNENCVRLTTDTLVDGPYRFWNDLYGFMYDVHCDKPAYSFVCKKPGCPPFSTFQNGSCFCNEGYVDIVDTRDAGNYLRGEKCVEGVCNTLKGTTSVLFLVDSSESITKAHWPSLVQFVKDGALQLPKTFRVGFVKFSSKVTASKWVEPGWTVREYQNAVPTKYDKGQTNTPTALKHAKKMLTKVRSDNKIVVLITDGLPMSVEYDTEKAALSATSKAAKELINEDIRLTVMGVGPSILSGVHHVKKWLKNPQDDYFSFADTVDCLKRSDMDKLLNIVCRTSNR